ncbi:MAG: hypothetical protein JWM34_1096 [Ilumatobacteraceae bacterium]|nr:hypothetical protein [Ilumatobacteraceae bacterium]
MAHPERLVVEQATHTLPELDAISTSIAVDPPYFSEVGTGWLAVDIQLAPGLETYADELLARWGDALRITLGSHTYRPAGCDGPDVRSPVCPDLIGTDPADAGIALRVVPDQSSIHQWEMGKGQLEITNTGSAPFTLDSGSPVVGVLVAPGTDHVIGDFAGGIAGVGGGPVVAPGGTGSIDLIYGANRCDGGPGSAVPPGVYGLRVAYTAEGPPGGPTYLSPEVPITVTG